MSTTNSELATLFLEVSRHELFEKYWSQLRGTVSSLTDEQVWWRPNDASNSIGNLLLHLNGNVRQWLITSFSDAEDKRNRPQEFAEREFIPVNVLLEQLGSTLKQADAVLAHRTPEQLASTYVIMGKAVSGLEAIFHCVSHFILHYGQIVYIAKSLQNRDLGFYREPVKTGPAH